MFLPGSKARLPILGPRKICKEAMTDMDRVGRRGHNLTGCLTYLDQPPVSFLASCGGGAAALLLREQKAAGELI